MKERKEKREVKKGEYKKDKISQKEIRMAEDREELSERR